MWWDEMISFLLVCSSVLVISDGLRSHSQPYKLYHHHHHENTHSPLTRHIHQVNYTGRELRVIPKIPRDTRYLLLNHNHLKDLIGESKYSRMRGALTDLDHLLYLDISHNHLKILHPSAFHGLKRLETLLITNNELTYLHEHAFGDLDSLKVLNLSYNKLEFIALETFRSIPSLQNLNLDGNHITILDGGLFSPLRRLIRLSLAHNRLIMIKDNTFVGLDSLEEIYLHNNHLEKVPSLALQSLRRLRLLNIGANNFTSLQADNFMHQTVATIWIDRCPRLEVIEHRAFWDLPALTDVHLEHCALQYIDPQAFLGVPSLATLYLNNNSLYTIQEDLVNNILHRPHSRHSTLNISLHFNPLQCDCNIHFIYRCLTPDNQDGRINLIDGDQLKCSLPPSSQMVDNSSSSMISDTFNSSSSDPHTAPNHSAILIRDLNPQSIPSECPPSLMMDTPHSTLKQRITPNSNDSDTNIIRKRIGDRIMLPCRVAGLPHPSIHWILPSGKIFNSSDNNFHLQLKAHGLLKILHFNSNDSGEYTCVAQNRHGIIRKTVKLIVDNPLIQIWPLGVSSTFVSIVWNATQRIGSPEYQILYKKEDDPTSRFESITIKHLSRSYTITDLEPHQKYRLCIAIRDGQPGDGVDQQQQQFVTLSCTSVQTDGMLNGDSLSVVSGLDHTSNLALKLSIFASILLLTVALITLKLSKHSRQRLYETPQKSLLTTQVIPHGCCSPATQHHQYLYDQSSQSIQMAQLPQFGCVISQNNS
ncbi:uncharacterized protein LOC141849561 [Brevipalpus obovatus]|uniref:uncharacterized protein LOC141849561 n=1 Tax=Brevipalpus obovatus TaxID=246614 RepID=UPI003D9F95D1